MITEQNIFSKGMLISLHMGAYSGHRKLTKDQMSDLPTEIVRGVHDIFDKEFKLLLKEIYSFDNETRSSVKMQSIPFPVDGIYFVSSERIESIIDFMEHRKSLRAELIQKALDNYDEAIAQFAEKYPQYAARAKYLRKDKFQERFYCKYQFLKISAPDEEHGIISPEAYKKEMAKFRETIDEMKKDVVETIYFELMVATSRLKKQCTDGKPNQRTINTMNNLLTQIDTVYSDFVDREDLKDAIVNIKKQMFGMTAEQLRDSDHTREEFRKGISEIFSEIKNLPDIPLKRAIDF